MLSALLAVWSLATSSSDPVLILIEPGRRLFNPAVDPNTYTYGNWVRWPEEALPPRGNRLLSIATGLVWQGQATDFAFVKAEGGWRARSYPELAARGHFEARERVWGRFGVALLQNENGGVRPRALMLALDGNNLVRPFPIDGPWPKGKTMVIEAQSEAEIPQIVSRTDGPVMVLEYPPQAGQNWSQFSLLGRRWPRGLPLDRELGIPGLVAAESVGRLLMRPESFEWVPENSRWPGANRWLAYARSGRPIALITLGFLASVLAVASAVAIGQERRSGALAGALRVLAVSPVALVVGGNLAHLGGLTGGVIWVFVALLSISGLGEFANLLLRKTGARSSMLGYAAVGLAALLVADPRYSVFSGVLGRSQIDIPPEPLGAMLACFVVVLGQSGALRKATWIGGLSLTLVLMAMGLALPVWWKGSLGVVGWAFIWLVPAVLWALHGKWAQLVAGFVGGAVVAFRLSEHGYAFIPYDLLTSVRQVGGVNSFDLLRFLVSPLFLVSALLAGAFALFGTGFFNYQVRQTWLLNRSARCLTGLAGFLAVVGLAFPSMLDAALIAALAAGLVLFESLLAPDA